MTNYETSITQPPAEVAPAIVRSRVSGALGHLGIDGASAELSAGLTTNALLDSFEATGVTGAVLESDSSEVTALLDTLRRGPHLQKDIFIANLREVAATPFVTIHATADKPVQLPVADFVSAPGIPDWRGREHVQDSQVKLRALRKQRQRGDIAAPIDYVMAYVQPNGRTVYSAVHEGAHRLMAARARGDETIAVGKEVVFKRLAEDIVESD